MLKYRSSSQISHPVNGGRTFVRIVGNTFKKICLVIRETAVISVTNTVKAWKRTHKLRFYAANHTAHQRPRSHTFLTIHSIDSTIMSRDQKAGRSYSMKIDNSSIERVEEFKYLGTTLTKKILFRKKLRAD